MTPTPRTDSAHTAPASATSSSEGPPSSRALSAAPKDPHVMDVALVAPDRQVWQGVAISVSVVTTEGGMGVLVGHESLFSVLMPCVVYVKVRSQGGNEATQTVKAAVSGGFISVHENHVSVLAEKVVLPADVDADFERHTLAQAQDAGEETAVLFAKACLQLLEENP